MPTTRTLPKPVQLLLAAVIATVLTFTSLGAAPKAFAGSATGEVAKVISSTATASTSTTSKNTSVNNVSVASKTTVLEYIQANGGTKAQLKKAKTYKLKKSKKIWTSYYNTSGQEVWHKKSYKKGYKFYYSSKDKRWHDKPCWNKVALKVKKKGSKKTGTKVYGSIKVVKTHSFKVWSTSKSTSKAVVSVTVSCKTEYTSASATATATAYATSSATAYAYGSTVASASASARGSSVKLAAKVYSAIKAKATATATSDATAEASAKVDCKEKPTPTPPPAVNQPPSGSIKAPQHLYVGGTYCAKFYGSDPEDKGNVTMTPSISGPASFTPETGNCAYRDDTENAQRVITQPFRAGDTPGTVKVTLKVTDKEGKSVTVTESFPVLADDFPF